MLYRTPPSSSQARPPGCLVCQRVFPGKPTKRRKVCDRPPCRYRYKRYPELFLMRCEPLSYPNAPMAHNVGKIPTKSKSKTRQKSGRGSRIIAGPVAELPTSKANAAFREYVRRKSAEALIQRDTPPVNLVGGFKFPGAPKIDLNPTRVTPRVPAIGPPLGDGLDIPDFLKRTKPAGETV